MQQLEYCPLLCFEVFYGLYSLSRCVYTVVLSVMHTHLQILTGMSLHMATNDGLPLCLHLPLPHPLILHFVFQVVQLTY